ncbi:hypothetical protein ACFWNG_30145 [Streptomyces sp. NPDC058391]|uniref:hypothetical protein n=1 Tax=Streptomyces sp. NPDC058391 TaxID=3346476 RepID=UPI00365314E0
MPDTGSQGTALAVADTAKALARYRACAGICVRVGLTMLMGSVIIALTGEGPGWPRGALPALIGVSLFCSGLGLLTLRLSRRMRDRLAAGPWMACAAEAVPRGIHAAAVVLRDPATGELWPLTVIAIQQRYHLAQPGPDGSLWWCGDPRTGGVIAPPGGADLIWTQPVRGRWSRQRVVRAAQRQGLLDRQASPQPASPPQPPPPPPPPVSELLERDLRWERKPARRRGGYRWVLLAGVVLLGPGIAGSLGSEKDPQIDLTVIAQEPDGTCEVRWTDPWSGERREGPFHCDPDRDPLLDGWWTGWVVSYGPWKGELYDSDLRGTVADEVNAALSVAGGALTLTGLVGGFKGRQRRNTPAEPPVEPPAEPAVEPAEQDR